MKKYVLYALGEIVLITIGVLIAVNINQLVVKKQHKELRCQYLEELSYTFNFDMKDVEENIAGFNQWNPKLEQIIYAIHGKKLIELDSLQDRMLTVNNYLFFNQRTKTKMEELKYSNVDLIGNRELKSKLLLYQDEQVEQLLNMERRYNIVDEEVRQYYSINFYGGKVDFEMMQEDSYFVSLVRQKHRYNHAMRLLYEQVLEKQVEIKKLIELEKEKNCSS